MISILAITKGVATAATSIGIGSVVGNAVKATTPFAATRLTKTIVGVGGLALTALVSEAASRQTEAKIDEAVQAFDVKDKKVDVDVTVEEEK